MARFQKPVVLPAAPLLLLLLQTVGMAGSTPQLFGTGQQICNYQYAVPYGGNCVTYGPALEQKVEAVQSDLDLVKLQLVSDTSVLREELRKLSQQTGGADTRLGEVSSGLRAVQTALAALQAPPAASSNGGGGGGSSATALAMLEQLVKTTQAQLTQDMLKLENQLHQMQGGLQDEIMGNGVQQSRVDQALQSQLRQQQTDLTTVMRQLQQLDQRVNSLERVTHSPGGTPTPTLATSGPSHVSSTTTAATTTTTTTALPSTTSTRATSTSTSGAAQSTLSSLQVQQLQQDIQQLESRLSRLESDYQVDVPELKNNITFLAHLTANHSLELSSVKTELEYVDSTRLPELEQRAGDTYNALRFLTQRFDPVEREVRALDANVTSMGSQLSGVGTKIMTEMMQVSHHEHALQDLTQQLAALQQQLQQLGITTPVATTTHVPVPSPMRTMVVPPRRTTTTTPSSG